MPRPICPYRTGDSVGNSPAFVGRDDVLRDVLKVLRSPSRNAIALYGQRRIGKTSMLQHLKNRLPQEGSYLAVYFDLQDKAAWSLPRLLIQPNIGIPPMLGITRGNESRQQIGASSDTVMTESMMEFLTGCFDE